MFRQQARVLWQRMQKRTLAERRSLVEEDPEFRSWALCELTARRASRRRPTTPTGPASLRIWPC